MKKFQIPNQLLNDSELKKRIQSLLPSNYEFEVEKSLFFILQNHYHSIALQFPEGLQCYALPLTTIFQHFTSIYYYNTESQQLEFGHYEPVEVTILADVTYGACCIDDYSAKRLGCQAIIHYGHSCLIPIGELLIPSLYVFVQIKFDLEKHLLPSLIQEFSFLLSKETKNEFSSQSQNLILYEKKKTDQKLFLFATIQFQNSLFSLKQRLEESLPCQIEIPQMQPLSSGEVLGCTSPKISAENVLALVYIGDGRFHLESMMLQNPHLQNQFYQYDPYSCKLTREYYDYEMTLVTRQKALNTCQSLVETQRCKVGLVMGTLGRQGSLKVIQHLKQQFQHIQNMEIYFILLSELSPQKLKHFSTIDFFVQNSCPRLSIDWGDAYPKPLLTPYESVLITQQIVKQEKHILSKKPLWYVDPKQYLNQKQKEPSQLELVDDYPMDYYAKYSLGEWTPNHVDKEKEELERQERRRLFKKRLEERKNK